jgi:hypothetical protein
VSRNPQAHIRLWAVGAELDTNHGIIEDTDILEDLVVRGGRLEVFELRSRKNRFGRELVSHQNASGGALMLLLFAFAFALVVYRLYCTLPRRSRIPISTTKSLAVFLGSGKSPCAATFGQH